MNYTLSAAAKAAGVAKSTISKALNSGALSKVSKVGNSYRIDPAELKRWMDEREKRSETLLVEQMETPQETPLAAAEKAAYQREIDLLREQLDEMKEDKKFLKDQLIVNTRLLEDNSKSKGFIERIFGKSDKAV